jgi:hypothetical protein
MKPRDAAMSFEGKKISMRQDGKGTYITISIHPGEVPVDLLAQPVGCRYQIAMVMMDDHDQPVKGKDMEEGDRAVQSAAMLCRNPRFQQWMVKAGLSVLGTEEACSDGVRAFCKVESRAEFKSNREARETFFALRDRFENSFINDL